MSLDSDEMVMGYRCLICLRSLLPVRSVLLLPFLGTHLKALHHSQPKENNCFANGSFWGQGMEKEEERGGWLGHVGCPPGILGSYGSFQQNEVLLAILILTYYELMAWQCFLCVIPSPPPSIPSHCESPRLWQVQALPRVQKPANTCKSCLHQATCIFQPFGGILILLLILQMRKLKIRVS